MAEKVRTITIKSGMPTAEEARARLNAEIDKSKQAGVLVLKIIHGYGSSGEGGRLKEAIRRSLQKRRKEKKISSFVAGEKWSVFEPDARQFLEACPELKNDPDLNRYNEGMTLVLL